MTTREQFLQRLRRYCRKHGLEFRVEESLGKGSHYRVYVDGVPTTVPAGEMRPDRIRFVLKQLGLPADVV